ncbi:GSCFA domain-containing protein [Hansschlegelia plantiphila]|uniref:GSCFA domain-containing protein n=1 Tax=Hansschlegelia plantiphila TaxID=374655 RepID=A0A9W6IX84_9HYPH|nr:GSCFA domain-containing protein [Hansschlegelia plantiphila]GLK66382.1 hypothetical protein GCM10008179_00200 [Hansschlegelia plantiphila]
MLDKTAKQNWHPYRGLPQRAFWKNMARQHPLAIDFLYQKKFSIDADTKIASAGSCFAQHVGRALRQSGFNYLDYEPAPSLLPEAERSRFGYGMFSARYGNVYTARQLRQLFARAFGKFKPVDEFWEAGGRFFDPYRPTIEEGGFSSLDELRAMRDHHLKQVRKLFKDVDLFVFTLGLTETWLNKNDGAAYQICPGTTAGQFDPDNHVFENASFVSVLRDMETFIIKFRAVNPDVKMLLTVSPVPLAATATPHHVLTATSYSKATLRAVAGYLAEKYECVDYFPSYEIVSSHPFHGFFFERDLRNVNDKGVDFVMSHFFGEHKLKAAKPRTSIKKVRKSDEDVWCDEKVLERYA